MLAAVWAPTARAENAPGVTNSEIRLGQTMSYTGVAAAIAGPLGKSEQAYFAMINDQGGVNGRKIVLESLDDGFDPQKALALVKKMVEQDHVAAIFSVFATPQNLAIRGYLNENKIPDLFIVTGDEVAGDYRRFPWTIGGVPVFRIEAQVFGRYILVAMPKAKVAILRSMDEMGDSYRTGLRQGLGAQFDKRVVKEEAVADLATNIDPQLKSLRDSGADVLVAAGPPTMIAHAIAWSYDSGWHPTVFINFASSSGGMLRLAGADKAKGAITANSYQDPTDPRWNEDGSIKPFTDFVAKYLPGAQNDLGYLLAGYVTAQAMVQVLKQCDDDLSRDNIMRQAASLQDFHPVGLLPGISFYTSRTKYVPIVEAALQRFDGQHWRQFGEIMAGF